MCRPGMTYHGKTLDLDVKDADVEEVIRLLADVAGINIVVADGVQGKVTFKVKHVAWDALLCTIAGMHKLTVTVDGNIVLVKQ